jgi:outer membrane lipoprotein-sorting protein
MIDPNRNDNSGGDELLERSLSAMRNAPIPDGPSEQLIADTLAALDKAAGDRLHINNQRKRNMRIITRLAASLLVAFGVAALLFFAGRTSSVALADVIEKVRGAKTLSFNATADYPAALAQAPRHFKFMMKSSGQTRIEMGDGMVSIMDIGAGRTLNLQPASKLATIVELGKLPQGRSPTDFLEEFKKLDAKKAKDLGEKEIDGRRVKGFVSSEQGPPTTVWADVKTGDPVRVEIEIPMMGKTSTMVLSDFVFNAPMDDGLFSLEPPAGYRVQRTDMSKMLAMAQNASGEDHVIAVLRKYAEMSDGAFPPKIDDWSTFAKLIGNKAEKAAKPSEKDMELMGHVGALTPFLMGLPKDDWAYLGDGVKLGDKDRIVFWYLDGKTSKYRAVYGDLSAREIAVADLPKR